MHDTRPPTASHEGYRADIQGLRALAVVVVVIFHAGVPIPGGFVAVDVFFAISGYVITRSLMREWSRSSTISMRKFYIRRVRRILPMAGLVGAATMIGTSLVYDDVLGRDAIARTGRAAALFVANLHLYSSNNDYFAPFAERNPFLHTWSLSVEEQFYAVLPGALLLIWTVTRRARSPHRVAGWIVLALTIVSAAAAITTVNNGDREWAFFAPHLRAWEFGVGVLLALWAADLPQWSRRTATIVGAAGLTLIIAPFALYDLDTPFPGIGAVPPVLGAALVIAAGPAAPLIARPLGWTPFEWIGDRSYGWYLWHWPAIVVAQALWPHVTGMILLAGVGSLALAAFTYTLMEAPVRRQAMTGVAALAIFGVVVNVPVGISEVIQRDIEVASGNDDGYFGVFTKAWDAGCGQQPDLEDCTYRATPEQPTILLLGDSHATALSDAVTVAAEQLGLGTVVYTQFGCPALPRSVQDRRLGHEGLADRVCPDYHAALLEVLERTDPVAVVVAHRSPAYLGLHDPERDTPGFGPIKDVAGTPAQNPDEALAIWQDGLAELAEQIPRPMLIVAAVAEFPKAVEPEIILGRRSDARPVLTIEAVEGRRGEVLAIEERLAGSRLDLDLFDPMPTLCSAEECSAREGDEWIYFDGDHLRASATRRLVPGLRDHLRFLLTGVRAPTSP